METNKELIRSVIDRVLWTANATEYNRNLLAEAIDEAIALSQRSEAVDGGKPFSHVIVDANGNPEFVTLTHDEAQAHINDAISEHNIEGAGKWRVIPAHIMRPTDDKLWDQALSQRDHNAEMADKLADAIGAYFGADVGEHSNANCPWHEALRVIEESDEYRPAPAPSATAGEQVPYGWLQFIDGVKTQNFARDEKELANLKMVARVMKVAGHIEYVPVFNHPPVSQSVDQITDFTARQLIDFIYERVGFTDRDELIPEVQHHFIASANKSYAAGVRDTKEITPAAQPTPAQGDAVPMALSDEDIVSVLHGCGIDTHPSKYGFTELQVSATSIPSIREVVRRCNELLATRQSSADAVDAARYRWLCNGNGYFMEENSLCGHSNEKELADSAIDAAIAAQGGKE